jgi:hypothetical protein
MSELEVVMECVHEIGDVVWANFHVVVGDRRYPCGGAWLVDDAERKTVQCFYWSSEFAESIEAGRETLRLLRDHGVIDAPLPEGPAPEDFWSEEASDWRKAYDEATGEAQLWAARQLGLKF